MTDAVFRTGNQSGKSFLTASRKWSFIAPTQLTTDSQKAGNKPVHIANRPISERSVRQLSRNCEPSQIYGLLRARQKISDRNRVLFCSSCWHRSCSLTNQYRVWQKSLIAAAKGLLFLPYVKEVHHDTGGGKR